VLARTAAEVPLTRERRWRVLAYAGWGLVAGLALWSDPLLIPFIVTAGWLLVRFCRRELHWPAALGLVLGFMLPMTPIIIYNFTVPFDKSTLAVTGSAFWVQGKTLQGASPWVRMAGTLFIVLPRTTGGNVLCYVPHPYAWPLFAPQNASAAPCTLVNGMWGVGFALLLTISAALAFATYRALRKMARIQPWSAAQKRAAVGAFAQLMLIGSAALTLIAYTSSSPAGLDPWTSTRYLTSLPIVLPTVLWPLWQAGKRVKTAFLAALIKAGSYALLLLIVLSFVLGYAQTLALVPGAQLTSQQDAALVQDLLKMGVTRIYTDYWTCDRIAFESAERIVCSVVDERLQPGVNRYPPYTAIVKADAHAAWIFPVNSAQVSAFTQKAGKSSNAYISSVRDGYVIYLPRAG
jgi:hypothetical protein